MPNNELTDDDIAEIVRRVAVSRKAITDFCTANKLPRGAMGKIPCPVCQAGQLHFSRASYNGHISARCSTPECVQWIE